MQVHTLAVTFFFFVTDRGKTQSEFILSPNGEKKSEALKCTVNEGK